MVTKNKNETVKLCFHSYPSDVSETVLGKYTACSFWNKSDIGINLILGGGDG
jgi:hypothetical protein